MVDAREYHERTNHSPESIRHDTSSLNYANKPQSYKIYENLPRRSLPKSPRSPG